MIPFEVALWASVSAIPLFIGSVIARYLDLGKNIVAVIMAFGSGALISVITFSLMREAYHLSGIVEVSFGFFAGAVLFTVVNKKIVIDRIPVVNKTDDKPTKGSGISMAIGSLIDNVPEGLAIGITFVVSGTVGIALVLAITASNFSEAISGSNAMKFYKKSPFFIHGVWGLITIANVISATLGFYFLSNVSNDILAIGLSLAAGAILAMLAETMMPEVFKMGGPNISIATAGGFMFAFLLVILNVYELRIF